MHSAQYWCVRSFWVKATHKCVVVFFMWTAHNDCSAIRCSKKHFCLTVNNAKQCHGLLKLNGYAANRNDANGVANHFHVQRNTISSLWGRYLQQGNAKGLPRSGRPRVTSTMFGWCIYGSIPNCHIYNSHNSTSPGFIWTALIVMQGWTGVQENDACLFQRRLFGVEV